MAQILVRGDEHLELRLGQFKQCAIFDSSPTHFLNSTYCEMGQPLLDDARRAFVQENVHAAWLSLSRVFFTNSSTRNACSRVTVGKLSKNSSSVRPASRLFIRASTGTRVP